MGSGEPNHAGRALVFTSYHCIRPRSNRRQTGGKGPPSRLLPGFQRAQVDTNRKREGRVIAPGGALTGGVYDAGYYVKPAVFADVSPQARIAQDEIFGPVIAVMKASDFDEAIAVANDTVYGLTGSVFTKDPANMAKADAEFYVGNLYINRRSTGAWIGAHPFGGYNMSGTAVKLGGPEYLAAFMQHKLVTRRVR